MGFKENLKTELMYQGMLVKELAALSGVNKFSIDNYLNARGQVPSAEAAVKIARVLGVSVEYLVMGEESNSADADGHVQTSGLSAEARTIARLAEQLDVQKRKFVIDFIQWIKSRKNNGV
jgi:transcriptional regulator with XRE-family HTH domain